MVVALRVSVISLAIVLKFSEGYEYDAYTNHYNTAVACIPGYDKNCNPDGTRKPTGGDVVVPDNTDAPFTDVPSTDAPFTDTPSTNAPFTDAPTNSPAAGTTSEGPVGPDTAAPTLMPDPKSTQKDCTMKIPPECVFPFSYKNLQYSTCTARDAINTLWCSTDAEYQGHWKQCVDPCKGKWPVKAIVSSVVAGGVAATGIGLIAAALDKNNPLGASWQASTTGPAGPAYNISEPAAPARLLSGFLERFQSVMPADSHASLAAQNAGAGSVALFAVIAILVCGFACLCSIAAAAYTGFGKANKKQGQSVTPSA